MKNELRLDDPARDPRVTRTTPGPAPVVAHDAHTLNNVAIIARAWPGRFDERHLLSQCAAYLSALGKLAAAAELQAITQAKADGERIQAQHDALFAGCRAERARGDDARREANRTRAANLARWAAL